MPQLRNDGTPREGLRGRKVRAKGKERKKARDMAKVRARR